MATIRASVHHPIEKHVLRHRVQPLHVLACGEGEPLVLLHGWGLAGVAYEPAMRAFAADGWRVIAPTVRVGERWSLDIAGDLCAEAMAGMDMSSATLVGHSYGGLVGVGTAFRHPGFVRELIAISTPFVPIRQYGVRRFLQPGRQYRLAGHMAAVRAMARTAMSPGGLANLTRIARWFFDNDDPELRERLKALTLPRALIWAENDSLFPPEVGEASAAVFGGRYMTVENADGMRVDHDWPMRMPKHFAQTVGGLARVLASEKTRKPGRASGDQ
jgi:pimeloyl-ACP methyl ester carboxylesterase